MSAAALDWLEADLAAQAAREDLAEAAHLVAELAVDAEPEMLLDLTSGAGCRELLLDILCAHSTCARPEVARAHALEAVRARLREQRVQRLVDDGLCR